VYVPTRKRLYDFDGIVAESGTNDTFGFCVEREVIDATSDVG
jgi:hypothetical protein